MSKTTDKSKAGGRCAPALGSAPVDVIHEEIITHPDAVHRVNGWRGEARVMGIVKINGRDYRFDQVISLRLHDPDDD